MNKNRWATLVFSLALGPLLAGIIILAPPTIEADAGIRQRTVPYRSYAKVVRQRNQARAALADAQNDIAWYEHQMILQEIRLHELVEQLRRNGIEPDPSSITP
jgi:hypothetical protein